MSSWKASKYLKFSEERIRAAENLVGGILGGIAKMCRGRLQSADRREISSSVPPAFRYSETGAVS